MKKSSAFFILLGVLLCCCSCSGDKPTTVLPNPYVSAYSGGLLPAGTLIKVRLAQELKSGEALEKQLNNIFRLHPSVDGEVFMEDAFTVVFRPAKRLKSATAYTVDFKVSNIRPEASGSDKTFTFSFSTLAPSFTYTTEGLRLYEGVEGGDFYLQGAVRTADLEDNSRIEDLLSVEAAGKALKVSWDHTNAYHTFTVEHIMARDEAYPLLLKWDGAPIKYKYAKTDSLRVPAKDVFELLHVAVHPEDLSVDCFFSMPLDPRQKYASYIQAGDFSRLRFTVTSNKLKVYLPSRPEGRLPFVIKEGLQSVQTKVLPADYTDNLLFEELKPLVRMVGKGVVMPNSTGLHLPFQAVNLRAVDVLVYRTFENNVLQFMQVNNLNGDYELSRVALPVARKTIRLDDDRSLNLKDWNTFSIDLSSLIAPEPGAIYNVRILFNKRYSLYPGCGEGADTGAVATLESLAAPQEIEDDNYWWASENPCEEEYYHRPHFVSQNVLATDIGLIVKHGSDKNYMLFASHLVTAEPLQDVKVTFYNFQQQPIGEGRTGSNGVLQLELKETPYIVVARQGNQKSYLRLGEELSLSLSAFDVAGMTVENGLKGMIYGERGVWRPGDTLFLTFVMDDRRNPLPANHPVSFELYNVNRQLVSKQLRTEGRHGFYTFICPTEPEAPTGNWTAYVKVGGAVFSQSLRVATVKPNRLKIDITLDHDPVMPGQPVSGRLNARWLHGAKTAGNRTALAMKLLPVATAFNSYPDYVFDDITKQFTATEEKITTGRLNENGETHFSLPLATGQASAGKLRAAVRVHVFENEGEYSEDYFQQDVYPYKSYVGLKMPKGTGYDNRLETNKDNRIEMLRVDASGRPLQGRLLVEVFRSQWSWWWYSANGNIADYASRLYSDRVYTTELETDEKGKAAFNYKLPSPDWGVFVVKVTDTGSGHSSAQKMYIDWWSYGRGDEDGNAGGATLLTFSTDKKQYNVGEKAEVIIPSAPGARLIVTVENSTKVLATYQLECKGKESRLSIPTTKEMMPNAYVYVSLLQPHAGAVNDLPMRLYGVLPLVVEDPQSKLTPVLHAPAEIAPGHSFTVNVKEEKNRDMTYTLAIVDEGLLDLTRFKTPDLWGYFYQREALGVRTWDLYNFVLGAYGGKIAQLFSIGGDDALNASGKRKADRFKPVVRFAGPFTLKGGQTGKHMFNISNYVGSVRVMVVAGNKTAYGKAEKSIPVRSPLMVQATLPRVLGPGEEVTLPVSVFAMDKRVKQVKVELSANALLEVADGATRSLTFNSPSEAMVKFKLKTKDKLGVAQVKLKAVSGNDTAEQTIDIEVRAANPPLIVSKELVLQDEQSATLALDMPGVNGSNTVQLETSAVPPLNLGARLGYLLSYPHGCLEQVTSCAFPQLFLPEVVDMNDQLKELMRRQVEAALQRLPYFARPDGNFSYWPGGAVISEWAACYAGHFMVEAEQKGYLLPSGLKEKWLGFQQKAARGWNKADTDMRYECQQSDLLQAYRLYVLAMAGRPELGAMNRLKERTDLSMPSKWMLAGAYALSAQPEAAERLINGLSDKPEAYTCLSNTYGSVSRDEAMILSVLSMMGHKENAFLMAKRVSEALNADSWMSTQSIAYSLMALSKFARNEDGALNFTYRTDHAKAVAVTSRKALWNTTLGNYDGKLNLRVDNKSRSMLYVRLTAKGIPAGGREQAGGRNLSLSVRYTDAAGRSLDVERLAQGTEFTAEVSVANPGQRGLYSNMALMHIFPSGWEIMDSRLENTPVDNAITYQDIRDDRVLSYFDLEAGKSLMLRVKLRAAYTGKFYLPAVACEAMYDASIHANTKGQQVEVY